MIEPLDAVADNSIRELGWLWPPGAGKTTAIEGAIQWRVVCSPSNILLIGQKDDTADIWWKTRMRPQMDKNAAMRPFMPTDRHNDNKGFVIFPHGIYLNVCGPSLTNLQEKSMPWVIFEEAWNLSDTFPGRFAEGIARTHDKWNSKVFFVGQAGNSHIDPDADDSITDLYKHWKQSTQRTFHFECPKCECAQPYKWQSLRYTKALHENGEVDWNETGKTVYYECANPTCGHQFKDTAKTRRDMASSLAGREQYRIQNHNARKGCEFYHMNILGLWRVPWIKSIIEFEDAMEAEKRGDKSKLEVFIKKRLAEFWTPTVHETKQELTHGGYAIADVYKPEKLEGELGRGIEVDVQQASVWYTAFAYMPDEGVRMIDCGEAHSLDEIETKRKELGVSASAVLVDSGYRPTYVYSKCAQFGFTACRGTDKEEFILYLNDGSAIKAPYSKVETVMMGNGRMCHLIHFAVNPIKDQIAEMRAGRIGSIITPDDVSPNYKKHLDAETRRVVEFGREKKMREIWVKRGGQANHLLDCTVYAVGYGMVRGWLRLPVSEESK